MQDGHLYMVPRLFPTYKQNEINKYGCVYDLCVYRESLQTNITNKLINFYILDSDARSYYPPYQIWSTSQYKRAIGNPQHKYETFDVTHIYANKLVQWYRNIRKQRAAKLISEILFEYMLQPRTGWLYKRSLKSWNNRI